MATKITVLGAGLMGSAIANCFVRRGYSVSAWNRTRERLAPLERIGIVAAPSVGAAISDSDVVFLIVSNYEVAGKLLEPIGAQLKGKVLVNGITGTAREARTFAAAARAQGATYLDASIMCFPVDIGTSGGMITYCGDESAWITHGPTLLELGGKSTYLGTDPALANIMDAAISGAFFNVALGGFLEAAAFGATAGLRASALAPIAIHVMELLGRILTEEAVQAIDHSRYGTDQATLDIYVEAVRRWRSEMLDAGQRSALMTANLHNLEVAQAAGHGQGSIYTQFLTASVDRRKS